MALVSGRPISFKMDLYNPLYVARPTVEPELFASLRPVAYSGAMRKAVPEEDVSFLSKNLLDGRNKDDKGKAESQVRLRQQFRMEPESRDRNEVAKQLAK